MLHTIAERVTEALYRHCQLEQGKKPVFVYGVELSISTLASAISIILISFLLQNPSASLSFLAVFFFLRLFAGGYHAPTYSKCFVLTNIVFLLTWTTGHLVLHFDLACLLPVISLISGIVIFTFAPIKNKKHPLSERTYQKNQKVARILVLLETLGLLGLHLLNFPAEYLAIPSVSLAAVAVMIILTFFERG